MNAHLWMVAKDGRQFEEAMSDGEVAALVEKHAGADILVWREGMAQWTDPRDVAEIGALLPAPAAPAKVSSTPSQPAAKRVSRVGASGSAVRGSGPGGVGGPMGFVKSLFDIRFRSFITPSMISTFYVIGMIVVGLSFIALVVSGFSSIMSGFKFSRWGMVFTGFVWLILSPVISIIYLAFIRMFFELVMVLFKIKDGIENQADGK